MSKDFVIDMMAANQKLGYYTPFVKFELDMYSAASVMLPKTLDVFCLVFHQLVSRPRLFFKQLLQCRRVCQAFWKFFFSAVGDTIPIPPLVKSLDLECWGMNYRVNPCNALNQEFSCNYSQWFYLLMTDCGGDRPYKIDTAAVRWIFVVDDVFTLKLAWEADIYEASTNTKSYHCRVDPHVKYSLWPPTRFPTRCFEYLLKSPFHSSLFSIDPIKVIFYNEVDIASTCKTIAESALYETVCRGSPTHFYGEYTLKVTPKLFDYYSKSQLSLYLSYGFYGHYPRDHPHTSFLVHEIWALQLNSHGPYITRRKEVIAHIHALYALAELEIPIVVQLMIDRNRNIKITPEIHAREPLWPTDFCLEWLMRNEKHRYTYPIQICFYILFCLAHGTRTVREETHIPLLREHVFVECWFQISENMKAQIPTDWFDNLRVDDLTYYEDYLLKMAGDTVFTPLKRKTNAAESRAKRRK